MPIGMDHVAKTLYEVDASLYAPTHMASQLQFESLEVQ
jgi:hypothetical protein